MTTIWETPLASVHVIRFETHRRDEQVEARLESWTADVPAGDVRVLEYPGG